MKSGWLRITTNFEGTPSSTSISSTNTINDKIVEADLHSVGIGGNISTGISTLPSTINSQATGTPVATIIPPGFSGAGSINKDFTSIYAWVVLRATSLFLYEGEHQKTCFGVASIEDCKVSLIPIDLRLDLYYRRDNPIMISSPSGSVFARSSVIFLFAPSAIEKEDWYLLMQQAIQKVFILFNSIEKRP